MTAVVYREHSGTVVVDHDDGCPPGRHCRDELCARTALASLPPLEPDDRGGAT